MSPLDDLLAQAKRPDARRERPTHPKGWEPGIAWDGSKGTVISEPTADRDPAWDDILSHFKFDPDEFEVVEPIEVRSWDTAIKNAENKIETTTLWYHRAKVVRRRDQEARADIDALIAEVKRHKPRTTKATGERALVVGFADWQLGKKGTADAVARILEDIDAVVARLKELAKAGRPCGQLVLANVGDGTEASAGQYPMQTFEVELNDKEQKRLARRLWVSALKKLAPLVERVVVVSVPGNHGENRNAAGKAYTSFDDNADIEILEEVAEILAENPDAYGHVAFVFPDDDLTVTLDVCGSIVAFAHGHQFPKSKHVEKAVWDWWAGQATGMQPAGDATILVSGHRHHFACQQRGFRTWLQCPTIDSGSTWFRNQTGEDSVPGTLTFAVDSGGWADLAIL